MTDNKQVMRAWLDKIGEVEAWPEMVADDIIMRLPFPPPGAAEEMRGLKTVQEVIGGVWKSWERFAWHDIVIRQTEDPDLLVTTARSEAMTVTGRPYANSYVMLTRFRNGRIVDHAEYLNPMKVVETFGTVSADA